MTLKLGSRIFLKKSFYDKLIKNNDTSKSSLAFGIVAITDYAINLKNLRTGKLYTIPIGELQDGVDEEIENQRPKPPPSIKKEIVTINAPVKFLEPIKPRRDYVYETSTATTLHFLSISAQVLLIAGPFAYLYE